MSSNRFGNLDLEAHSSCNYDYVDVFDGPNPYSPLIGRYCGNVLPTGLIASTSNTMTLNFVSDTSVAGKGFYGVYRTTYGMNIVHLIKVPYSSFEALLYKCVVFYFLNSSLKQSLKTIAVEENLVFVISVFSYGGIFNKLLTH